MPLIRSRNTVSTICKTNFILIIIHAYIRNCLQVLRLLQHLVKFGYYSDLDDVRHLLAPLLSQLDGRHDVPFPKDKSKGIRNNNMLFMIYNYYFGTELP